MQALDDWYLLANIKYDVFAQKYKLNGELEKQNGKIEEMKNWCDKMKIVATPTIFLNGYELPDAYGIEDLQYFLLELFPIRKCLMELILRGTSKILGEPRPLMLKAKAETMFNHTLKNQKCEQKK